MWTTRDIAFLRANAGLGVDELARLTGRSRQAVKAAAHRSGISLRRPGERRGLLLGQPRGLRLGELLPAADRETAALVLARQRIDEGAELCPSCCVRPVRVKSTGLCIPCHKRRLAEVHRELLAEREATRELWQARQALKRGRDKASAT